MARRPRIDLAGFHHVINRGVNRSNNKLLVFLSKHRIFKGVLN